MLLRNPELAWRLGRRGHGRLGRIFNEAACVDGYRELLRPWPSRRRAAPLGSAWRHDRRAAGAGRRRAVVEARLGREPQDMLEAAVVLEAWAGVPAQRALDAGARADARGAARAAAERRRLPAPPRAPGGVLVEGAAFVVTVLAIALLGGAAGGEPRRPASSSAALTLALPLTLALQWGLRSRYLDRPQGLRAARPAPPALPGRRGCASSLVPAAVLGAAAPLAGLLTRHVDRRHDPDPPPLVGRATA